MSDTAGVRRFVAVASRSFASADLPGHVTRSAFSAPERLLSPDLRLLVAWHEGRPAACALAISSHHVTGIYWVGALPRARGRGMAGVCVSALAHSAVRGGASAVVLQAARHLVGWYERIGFSRVSELSCYCALAPRRRLHERALESGTRRATEPLGSSVCWNEHHVIR